MKLNYLKFKNINSYGNITQHIKFNEEGSLNLIVGKNGAGKCVHPDTEIDIIFDDNKLEKDFVEFLNTRG